MRSSGRYFPVCSTWEKYKFESHKFIFYVDVDNFIDLISWCRRQHLQCRCRMDKSIQHDPGLWCYIYIASSKSMSATHWLWRRYIYRKSCVALKTSKLCYMHAKATKSTKPAMPLGTTSTADWLLTWQTQEPDIKNDLFSILTVHLGILRTRRPQCLSQNFKQIGTWRKNYGEILRRDCVISVLEEFRTNCILLCPKGLTSTSFIWCWSNCVLFNCGSGKHIIISNTICWWRNIYRYTSWNTYF